jgi:hypothetical protein
MEVVKDYTIRLYGPKKIVVTNSTGQTSTPSSHDNTFWTEILAARDA